MRSPVVAIIGAGMSGLCMAIKLKQAGIDSFTIYEKATEVGGTWRENTYPGLACDLPSSYYSYSFEPNPEWSRYYAPGPEIQRYFQRVADRYGVRERIEFGVEIARASFDAGRWRIVTTTGREIEADFLISACGILHHPKLPDIPGADSFAGPAFHSARWDHDIDLRGRRVGVIGSGSTGVQLVSKLPGVAGRVVSFQRTPQWIFPILNPRHLRVTRWLMSRVPALHRAAYRVGQAYVELTLGPAVVEPGWQRRFLGAICRLYLRTVRDRDLRRRLTPDHEPMCKRLLYSDRYYRAVQKPNVDVVTDPIERIEPDGVRTREGALHELDALVYATGFDAHAYLSPIELVGVDGVTLADVWRDGVRAFRSVALPGFPNFFMLLGPHSPFGNQSLVMVSENQSDYIARWIRMWADGEFDTVVPTPEATERYNAEIRAAMPQTVWLTGCKSWYIGKDGLPELWPWRPQRHREMLAAHARDGFELRAAERHEATV